jgi:hypothetical protein
MKKILATFIVLTLAILGGVIWRKESAFVYATHKSPDGNFVVRVMEYPRVFGHFPGDAGGGSGYVELIDTRTNQILKRQSTDVVMVIETIRWKPHVVEIKLFASWPLP